MAGATVVLMALLAAFSAGLGRAGLAPGALAEAHRFLAVITFAMPGYLVFALLRHATAALGDATPVLAITIGGAVLNVACNAVLWWAGGWGTVGVAASTVVATTAMAAALAWRLARQPWFGACPADRATFREGLALGIPVAILFALELGFFAVGSVLMGRLGGTAQAAHHLVMQVVMVAFIIPVGLSSALAYRIGHHVGAGAPASTLRFTGRTGLALGVGLSLAFGIVVAALAGRVAAAFGAADPGVLAVAATLVAPAAVLLVVDAAQNIAMGALRGVKSTRLPLAAVAVGNWALGLPLAAWAAHRAGPAALWSGLAAGLLVAATTLWVAFERQVTRRR